MKRRRNGFTLFQLLVVLALLLVLFALLLPALAQARLAAARAASQNNLKQIAIAVHNYHSTYNFMPAGNDANNFSALAHLLPYVEQDAVYRTFLVDWTVSPPTGNPWWTVGDNVRASRARIKTFLCPSDSLEEVMDNPDALVVATMYLTLDFYNGDGFYVKQFGAGGVGLTNYLGMNGVWGDWDATDHGLSLLQYKGLFVNATKVARNQVTLDALTSADGTSNTLMFGESLNSTFGTPRDVGFSWAGAGYLTAYYCIPSSNAEVVWGDWSSNHSGIVQFAYADGSGRQLRPTGRDPETTWAHYPMTQPERAFWALSGYADGDATRADGITN